MSSVALVSWLVMAATFLPLQAAGSTVCIVWQFEQRPDPYVAQRIRGEVEHIFRPAVLQFRWHMWEGGSRPIPEDCAKVIVLEMRGHCRYVPRGLPGVDRPLGWTSMREGAIPYHAVIDCEEIARFLETALLQSSLMRDFVYCQLVGRVIAHEMLHALIHAQHREDSEVCHARFRASDRLAAPRLSAAEVAALRQIAGSKTRIASEAE